MKTYVIERIIFRKKCCI